MTRVWDATANLRREVQPEVSYSREFWRATQRAAIACAATLAACALLLGVAQVVLLAHETSGSLSLSTARGERRSWTLSDGSRIVLNTDSRARVDFGSGSRQVVLEKGQARFEVAHDTKRPFVVRAGEEQIVATGTAFDVRWTQEHLSVVLVEGHVAILPRSSPRTAAALHTAATLEAGQRLEFETPNLAIKSTVRVDREEAWTTGRVMFDSTRLSSAVSEINRYVTHPIELADPALDSLLISGTFSADDSRAFARAIADVFSLSIQDTPRAIVLSPSSESRLGLSSASGPE